MIVKLQKLTDRIEMKCWEDWQQCKEPCEGLDKWLWVIIAGFMCSLVFVANLIVIVTILTSDKLKSQVI